MRSNKSNIFFTLLLWILITASAWPAFVVVNILLGSFSGEFTMLDNLALEPKRNFLEEFIFGYKASFFIAAVIGIIAAADYLILAQHKYTGIIAGLSLPITTSALAFIFYKSPAQLFLNFLLPGLGLYLIYRTMDLLRRIRRVEQL